MFARVHRSNYLYRCIAKEAKLNHRLAINLAFMIVITVIASFSPDYSIRKIHAGRFVNRKYTGELTLLTGANCLHEFKFVRNNAKYISLAISHLKNKI